MSNCFSGNLSELAQSQLKQFKEYAISHPQLVQVDMLLMGAIREPAGFAHVLVYGPSGVGKTTMIRQITRRLNGTTVDQNGVLSSGYRNGNVSPMPLLLVETRPPDGGVFNRADYYRTALLLLGEPFYERRMMVDIDAEQTWEKKGRSRSKASQFNDSPELRQALEEAMSKRGVKATSKSTRKKRSDPETVQADTPNPVSMAGSPEPKKKPTRKKKEASVAVTETIQNSQETTQDTQTSMTEIAQVQTQSNNRQTRLKLESPVVMTETTQNTPSSVTETAEVQTPLKKRQTQHKNNTAVVSEEMPQDTPSSKNEVISLTTESENVEAVPKKNGRRSVGQRKPQRDKVGE